ncbi:MAG: serine/threonine protein kinase [Deltaproteobacteria bacterium]|nr:serine/threonine protein kinase [Deltaproteobacteria bacterium]
MGAVWIGEHLALKTQVAVKFILAGSEHDSDARERFSREAEAAAQVKSPHVAQTFDHGVTADGVPFIVMELLEGEDLARHLAANGRLVLREAATIVTQVCRALARAHARGLIHRDVKPANIFLCDVGTPERFVKLLDFGVAKTVGDASTATKSGSVTGTPVYMAPEQLLGARDLDHRADLWSVAVVVYEMLVGRRPLTEENAAAIGVRLHTRGMPRASEGFPELTVGAAEALDAFFAKAWAIDRNERYDSALTLADDFENVVRVIYESQGVEPTQRYFLPIRQVGRHPVDLTLTVREKPDAAVSDVTLASGRLQIDEQATRPSAPELPRAERLPTESPISKQVRDSSAPAPAPAPPRSNARSIAMWSVAFAVLAAGATSLFVGSRGHEPAKDAGSASAAPPPPVTDVATPAAGPAANDAAPAQAASSPAPAITTDTAATATTATKATPKASSTAKPTSTSVTKKPPAATSASTAPTAKKLEDIE